MFKRETVSVAASVCLLPDSGLCVSVNMCMSGSVRDSWVDFAV